MKFLKAQRNYFFFVITRLCKLTSIKSDIERHSTHYEHRWERSHWMRCMRIYQVRSIFKSILVPLYFVILDTLSQSFFSGFFC